MNPRRIVTATVLVAMIAMGPATPAFADHLPGDLATDGSSDPYDRDAAVRWALDNAQAKQPFGSACTWFVSRSLWEGGMNQDSQWTQSGSHGHLHKKRPGTVSATSVEPFMDYFTNRYPFSRRIELDFTVLDVPEARLGDLIAYDWGNDGKLDHLSMIVSMDHANHPEVSEWGTLQDPSTYQKRVWTWSGGRNRWIQDGSPDARAWLLHIDTRRPLRF